MFGWLQLMATVFPWKRGSASLRCLDPFPLYFLTFLAASRESKLHTRQREERDASSPNSKRGLREIPHVLFPPLIRNDQWTIGIQQNSTRSKQWRLSNARSKHPFQQSVDFCERFFLYRSEASLNHFEPTEKSFNWRMIKVESWPRSRPVRLRQNLSRLTSDFIVLLR